MGLRYEKMMRPAFDWLPNLLRYVEHAGERRAMCERALAGTLDDRAIGDADR